MKKAARVEFFRRLQAANPRPKTELCFNSEFQLLIAVMLSAQATDTSVNRATAGLFAAAPDAVAMLNLGERGIRARIKSIGLFNTKAANIVKTCRLLVEKHACQVPNTRAELEALPGVGRKTANVVLNIAFGEPTIAVDTHIFRVSNRTGLAHGKTPLIVERKLARSVPAEYRADAHHWLILHGRYTCTARKPHCSECGVADLCAWKHKQAASAEA